jgi:hypothetical protein
MIVYIAAGCDMEFLELQVFMLIKMDTPVRQALAVFNAENITDFYIMENLLSSMNIVQDYDGVL